jgi:hypothetical protein
MHKAKRRTEVKQYYLSKLNKWACEDSYYEVVSDEDRTEELS